MSEVLYTQSQVLGILLNLVNGIGLCAEGETMPKRYKQQMNIGGKECWVTGKTLKELLEGYLQLCLQEGTVMPGIIRNMEKPKPKEPLFGSYLQEFNKVYKSKQQSLTKSSRAYIVSKHILPKWGSIPVDQITTTGLQEWFNQLEKDGYSHETLLKIKNNMSPALNSAVEDGHISRNPMKSEKLVIGGAATTHHQAIPREKMAEVRAQISQMPVGRTRNMAVLLCYLGLRFEEVLGLKWEDIDPQTGWVHIQRAVVHPTRNQPEIKPPKSKTSDREIPLPKVVWETLKPKYTTGFILNSYLDEGKRETPLSYSEAKREFNRIRCQFDLQQYTAHDFRDTCATEWRESGIPVDVISRMLGHSKSDITEKRYVKYRTELFESVRLVMNDPQPDKTLDKSQSMRPSEESAG